MACSGGGGSEDNSTPTPKTISGVAAAGSPIIGYVYVKDSTGQIIGQDNIAQDGSFSFDVKGHQAPFYLKAEGTVGGNSYNLYSATTTAGITNINPLTNLALAVASGVNDPAIVYNQTIDISQTSILQSLGTIEQRLQSTLQKYNATNINPLTDKFNADHTGLDAVFDSTNFHIDTSSGNITITENTGSTTILNTTITTLRTGLAYSFAPCSSGGDTITVSKVSGTSGTIIPGAEYEVCGTYTLNSRDSARISAANAGGSDGHEQQMEISRGSGNYCLSFKVKAVQTGYEKYISVGYYPSGGGSQFFYCPDNGAILLE